MSKRVEIGNWQWSHRHIVRMWLVEKFGANGDRWREETDYHFATLVMDDDVYMWYALKWGDAGIRSVPQLSAEQERLYRGLVERQPIYKKTNGNTNGLL